MFKQDEVADLDRVMFLARGCYAGSRLTNQFNTDRIGGHMATQIYGFNTIHGGGIFALENWKEKDPKIVDLIKGKRSSKRRSINGLRAASSTPARSISRN